MNSQERVFNTLQGKPVDRPPFTLLLSLYGARLTQCPLETYYSRSEAYIAGQRAVVENFDPDILFSPFCLVKLGTAFGGEIKYLDNYAPNLRHPAIGGAEEISRLQVPSIDSHPHILYFRESVRSLAESYGKEKAIAAVLLNPIDLPLLIMGINNWMETVLFDEEGTQKMLEITTPFFIEYGNALLEDGAHTLVLPSPFLTPTIVSREIVSRFTVPLLKNVFAQIKGDIVVHHVGAPFLEFLDLFASLPQVKGFVMDSRDDLSLARDRVSHSTTLFSGPDGMAIGKKEASQIEEDCLTLLTERREDPFFILTSTGADIPLDTPRENIDALGKAIDRFHRQDPL